MGKEKGLNTIPFNITPGLPALVSDVLEGTPVIDFGFQTKVDAEYWKRKSEEEAAANRTCTLSDRLLAQSEDLDLSDTVRDNIKALAEPGTLAVVTGQQVGIGGGPLLTLYKALSTIAIANQLEKSSGVKTVPVFWMATSDHNLTEAAQMYWINMENKLVGLNINGQENRAPVGGLPLGSFATEMIDKLRNDLPESEYKPRIMHQLETCYRPEETFGRAFHRLGNRILGQLGLVLLNPEDPELKRACRPFWERVIDDTEDRLNRLKDRSTQISDAGYKVQAPVLPGRPAIFVLEDGVRRKVVLEGRAQMAQSDLILNHKELKKIAYDEPERISVGVTLRPLYQGYMLPVGAYVAGPHEVAYWAQLPDTFEPLGIPKPAVLHRAAMTLVEKKTKRRLSKLGIGLDAFFGDISQLTEDLIQERSEDKLGDLFNKIRMQGRECNITLLENCSGEYTGLEPMVDASFKKIYYHIDKLENTFHHRMREKHSDVIRSIETLGVHLRPAGRMQERVISPNYYLARYGGKLLKTLVNAAEHYSEGHLILDLEEDLA